MKINVAVHPQRNFGCGWMASNIDIEGLAIATSQSLQLVLSVLSVIITNMYVRADLSMTDDSDMCCRVVYIIARASSGLVGLKPPLTDWSDQTNNRFKSFARKRSVLSNGRYDIYALDKKSTVIDNIAFQRNFLR